MLPVVGDQWRDTEGDEWTVLALGPECAYVRRDGARHGQGTRVPTRVGLEQLTGWRLVHHARPHRRRRWRSPEFLADLALWWYALTGRVR